MVNIINHYLKNPLTKFREIESNTSYIELRSYELESGSREKSLSLSLSAKNSAQAVNQTLSQCKHRFTRETKRIIGDRSWRNRQLHLSAFNRLNIAVFSIEPLSISKWEGMISHVKSCGLVRENCRNAAVKAVAP